MNCLPEVIEPPLPFVKEAMHLSIRQLVLARKMAHSETDWGPVSSLLWATAEQRQRKTQASHMPLLCGPQQICQLPHPPQALQQVVAESITPPLPPLSSSAPSWGSICIPLGTKPGARLNSHGGDSGYITFSLFRCHQPVSRLFLLNPIWRFLVRYPVTLTGSFHQGCQKGNG